MKPTKTIPTFRDENEEREFWENNDTMDYFDTSNARAVRFPNLKKTSKSISIGLPVDMLDELKIIVNSMMFLISCLLKCYYKRGCIIEV